MISNRTTSTGWRGNSNNSYNRLLVGLAVALAIAGLDGTAAAAVLFAQTANDTSSANGGSASDADWGYHIADDVTLATDATVRSVKWWGGYGPFNNTPVPPPFLPTGILRRCRRPA